MAKRLPHSLHDVYKTSILHQILLGYVTARVQEGGSSINKAVTDMMHEFGIDEDEASHGSLVEAYRRIRTMYFQMKSQERDV